MSNKALKCISLEKSTHQIRLEEVTIKSNFHFITIIRNNDFESQRSAQNIKFLEHIRSVPRLSSNSNRSFPSYLLPLFQNESMCETIHMKKGSACSFIFMQIKFIFIRMVSHLESL